MEHFHSPVNARAQACDEARENISTDSSPKAGSACPFFNGRLNCEISDFAKPKTGELGVEPDRRREVLTKYPFNSHILLRKSN